MTNMKKRIRNKDKFTGEKLVPIQVWVTIKTYNSIVEEANKNRQSINDFVRHELETLEPKEP